MLIFTSVFFNHFAVLIDRSYLCYLVPEFSLISKYLIIWELHKGNYIWPFCCSVHTWCMWKQDLNLEKDQTKTRLIFTYYLIHQEERQWKAGWALIMSNYRIHRYHHCHDLAKVLCFFFFFPSQKNENFLKETAVSCLQPEEEWH